MTEQQQAILHLIRNVHTLETWDQQRFVSFDRSEQFPCGTSCCLAGHIINQFADKDTKEKIIRLRQATAEITTADEAEKILVQTFPNAASNERPTTLDLNFKYLSDNMNSGDYTRSIWDAKNTDKHFALFADRFEATLEENDEPNK